MALKILLYGPPGVGKTTSLAHLVAAVPAKESVLIMDTEEGSIPVTQLAECVVLVESYADALKHAKRPKQVAVIDTIDGLVRAVRQRVVAKEGKAAIAEIEYGRGYQLVKEVTFSMLNEIDSTTNFALVMVGHSMEDERGFRPSVGYVAGRSVSEDLSNELAGVCHIIAYMDDFEHVYTASPPVRAVVKSRFRATYGVFSPKDFWQAVVKVAIEYQKAVAHIKSRSGGES